jgi:hypothetical protein
MRRKGRRDEQEGEGEKGGNQTVSCIPLIPIDNRKSISLIDDVPEAFSTGILYIHAKM